MPKFSIIIPIYNVAPYLRECLDSVLAQTCTDWEAICVDDGSTDASGMILDEYARRDGRFRVVHQLNSGVSVARNVALDVAQGDWLAFLDSDDAWNVHFLEEAVRYCESNDLDLLRFGCVRGSAIAEFGRENEFHFAGVVLEGPVAYRHGLRLFSREGYCCLNFMRRTLVGNNRFDPSVCCKEDGLWLLSLVPRVRRIGVTNSPCYFYRTTCGSLTNRAKLSTDHYVSYLAALVRIYKAYEPWFDRGLSQEDAAATIRLCADYNITEWGRRRNRRTTAERQRVLCSYRLLESKGVLAARSDMGWLFGCAFAFWRKTGLYFPIENVRLLFAIIVAVRKCVARAWTRERHSK